VKSGDFVVLDLRDARRIELIVEAVESDGIVASDGTRYLYTDIQRLQVRLLSTRDSVVVGIVVFVILLVTSLEAGGPGHLSGR
jgi:hypothetical protein